MGDLPGTNPETFHLAVSSRNNFNQINDVNDELTVEDTLGTNYQSSLPVKITPQQEQVHHRNQVVH